MATKIIKEYTPRLKLYTNVKRGIDYYKKGRGFEIIEDNIQLCGGGEYDGGVGFAIGIDRLLDRFFELKK